MVEPLHQYTHRNHFRFGYDGRWFAPRRTYEQKWTVAYGPCERPVGDWKTENTAAARLIADRHPDAYLLFSGGADSEVALRAFLDAGVPIRAVTVRYAKDLNQHDIRYAIDACAALGVEHQILDLDLQNFVDSGECDRLAQIACCPAPEVTISMWASEQVEGTPVVGQGECYLAKDVPGSFVSGLSPYDDEPWVLLEREWVASWYRFFVNTGRPAVPGFFQYTAEQILAFLNDPEIAALTANQRPGKLSTLSSKLAVYRRYYDLKPRTKYTGFEFATPVLHRIRSRLARRYAAWGGTARTHVPNLVASLVAL
jgi:hypothetical protein